MKVGFTVRKERQEYLATCCDRVVYLSMEAQTTERFYNFIKDNLAHEVYIEQIADIGLQLVQLAKVIDLLKSKNKMIYFIS